MHRLSSRLGIHYDYAMEFGMWNYPVLCNRAFFFLYLLMGGEVMVLFFTSSYISFNVESSTFCTVMVLDLFFCILNLVHTLKPGSDGVKRLP